MRFQLRVNGVSHQHGKVDLEVEVEYEADEIVAISNAFAANMPVLCKSIADAFNINVGRDFGQMPEAPKGFDDDRR